MVKVRKDLTSKYFGRLKVIKQSENDYINPQGRHFAQWECECGCGNPQTITVTTGHLTSGHTQSCGCLNSESKRKYNEYKLFNDYGIGYTFDGNEFYFDLEDYDKIKDYCWYSDKAGYIVSDSFKKHTKLHRLVMNVSDKKCDIDHINGRYTRHDNRKNNLRICTRAQNSKNKLFMSNNTSGCIGVRWHKAANKWMASITVDGKDIYLGLFNNKDEAIKTRIEAEDRYYKEFSPIREEDEI